MDDLLAWVKEHCLCCACEQPLEASHYVNLVALERKAHWPHPSMGNVITGDQGRALAIVCDACCEHGAQGIRFAIEWDERRTFVRYHDLNRLPFLKADEGPPDAAPDHPHCPDQAEALRAIVAGAPGAGWPEPPISPDPAHLDRPPGEHARRGPPPL